MKCSGYTKQNKKCKNNVKNGLMNLLYRKTIKLFLF